MRTISEIINRIAKIETRISNMVRFGTVAQVDAKRKEVRLRLGSDDSDPFLSPWVPYSQTAGALKIHTPPSVGQPFALMSDNGNMRQSVAVPRTWDNENPSPSEKGDEHVLTFGSVTAAIRGKQVIAEVGGAKFDVTDEKVTILIGGRSVELTAGGGHLK
ncbi:hypothetical protein [Bosea massiliensis]|uniref:Gp5/Type VI secretion system Vgr protein OB-fold domain-containing protein n=1 Tax=Bosea massiliensis TaxID=151419 RepID=A0ABW0P9F2_9HYPH